MFTTSLPSPQMQRTRDQSFYNWTLFPDADTCGASQLTPEGAAQHVRLGAHMRRHYLDTWRLLQSETAWDQIRVRGRVRVRRLGGQGEEAAGGEGVGVGQCEGPHQGEGPERCEGPGQGAGAGEGGRSE